jgi:cell division protein FtsQ
MNTMDHRIAERRHEVTEERAQGRLRWLIWVVVLVGAIAAAVWFVRSPVLAVRSVVVTGAERTDPSAVAAGLGAEPGTPTISVRAGEIEAALLTSPWVAEANVTVSWPGTIEINVRERTPIASIRTERGVFAIAVDGVLIEVVKEAPVGPMIVSDRLGPVAVGDRIRQVGTLGAAEFIAGLSPSLRRATTVSVTGDTASAVVAEYSVILGRPIDMAFKAAAVDALIASGVEAGSRIDVTAPTRPAVAPPQSQLEGETETLEQAQPSD